MTNCNYTIFSDDELVKQFCKINFSIKKLSQMLRFNYRNPIIDEIIKRTLFLDEFFEQLKIPTPFLARIYCLENSIYTHPTCSNPNCNNKVKWRNGSNCFAKYCSNECSYSDPKRTEQIKRTCRERYKCDNPTQSDEIKQKIKNTCIERYCVNSFSKTVQFRECIKNFWSNCSTEQKNEIKCKTKTTCDERYGGIGFASDQLKQKSRETNKVKNGSETYNNIKQHKMTCILKYEVDNYSKTKEYHKNKRHKYHSEKYPGITFDSTWEVKVYEFCMDNNIEVEYSPPITYEYEANGLTYTYHPDFLINNKVYEVKGDHFFKVNEFGQEVMINPYGKNKMTKDEYQLSCIKEENKHQCMIRNNVTILRRCDIKKLNKSMFI